jgi:ComF family protein
LEFTLRLSELKEGFIHLLYPRLCEGCNKPLIAAEQVLCISCATELPETDYHALDDNETALRFAGRVPFFRATSFAYFTEDGLLQHLLHRLKYKDRQEIGDYLGSRFAESLAAANWLSGIDIIIPVPLHASRQAERGYNQSMLIAAAIGRHAAIPATDAALLRVRETESQTRKSRTERTENMAEAFVVADGANLKGKHILIIDDVLTTGATIEACETALKAVENVKISIATIGIAVS